MAPVRLVQSVFMGLLRAPGDFIGLSNHEGSSYTFFSKKWWYQEERQAKELEHLEAWRRKMYVQTGRVPAGLDGSHRQTSSPIFDLSKNQLVTMIRNG